MNILELYVKEMNDLNTTSIKHDAVFPLIPIDAMKIHLSVEPLCRNLVANFKAT